jgi:hypothetical protein
VLYLLTNQGLVWGGGRNIPCYIFFFNILTPDSIVSKQFLCTLLAPRSWAPIRRRKVLRKSIKSPTFRKFKTSLMCSQETSSIPIMSQTNTVITPHFLMTGLNKPGCQITMVLLTWQLAFSRIITLWLFQVSSSRMIVTELVISESKQYERQTLCLMVTCNHSKRLVDVSFAMPLRGAEVDFSPQHLCYNKHMEWSQQMRVWYCGW